MVATFPSKVIEPLAQAEALGLLLIGPGLTVDYANLGAEKLTGFPRAELEGVGLDRTAFPVPAERERLDRLVERVLAQDAPCQSGFEYRSRRGHEKTMLASLLRIPGPEGPRVALFFHDFTARKFWEATLQTSVLDYKERLDAEIARHHQTAQRYRELFDNAPDMYHMIDGEGRILECNKAEAETLGYTQEELTGKTIYDLTVPEDVPLIKATVSRIMEGQKVRNVIRRFRKKNGEEIEVLGNAVPLLDEHGRAAGALSLFRDISEIRRYQRDLEEAHGRLERQNRQQAAYFAQASHELKTPISAILGFSDFLGRSPTLCESDQSDVERIRYNAQHLLELLTDLLDLSKTSAGVMEIVPEVVPLSMLLVNCREALKSLAQKKGLEFEFSIPKSLPDVRTDPMRFAQVMNNLIGNAVKYTEKGAVRVRAGETSGAEGRVRAVIHVQDTGPGISAEDLPRIFEPFHRAAGRTRKEGGTGLGLSVARTLARLLGGDVTASSEVGKGSTFTFTHPVGDE